MQTLGAFMRTLGAFMRTLGAFMRTLGALMQALRRFLEIHESFEPILVAECEDHAAEVLNGCRLRLLEEAFSPLRVAFDEHRGALEGHRVAFREHRGRQDEHRARVLPVGAPSVAHFASDVAVTRPVDAVLAEIDPIDVPLRSIRRPARSNPAAFEKAYRPAGIHTHQLEA